MRQSVTCYPTAFPIRKIFRSFLFEKFWEKLRFGRIYIIETNFEEDDLHEKTRNRP